MDFYTNIVGMQYIEQVDGNVYLRSSNDHHNLFLEEGPVAGLKRVGFELEKAEQFDDVINYLAEKILNPVELSAKEVQSLAQGRTLRFKDPILGVTDEMYTDMMEMGLPYESTNGFDLECLLHIVYTTDKIDYIRQSSF